MRSVRIFISSPGDVAEERDKARQIIELLQRRYIGQLQLVPVLWEDLPLGFDASFQEGIDIILSEGHGIDIAVFIIWSRLGSPLGRRILRPDGSAYRSGTEREFDLMLAARKASNGRRPAMLAYVRNDAEEFQERLRGQDTDDLRKIIEQKELAEQFVREQFHDTATGENIRAYHTYDKPIEYAHRLRVHLQNLLDEMVQQEPGAVRWEGPPFRGLEAFDVEHASIFFGREQEIANVLLALHSRAQAGCGAVVIAGASGAGKSSLVRAGIIPALVEQNLDSKTACWRYVIFRPGRSAPNFLTGLTQGLASESALPELKHHLDQLQDLSLALGESATTAYRLTIAPALRKFDEGEKPARLLIYVDQLEELFTHSTGHRETVCRFLKALRALAQTDRVRVLATVRSDFYAQCQEYDDLLAMKQGQGLYDLMLPGPAALQQIICRPALLAGLQFEEDATTGQTLDRKILDDANEHPEALPQLQYVLRELFEKRQGQVLTFESYRELGGVAGALSRRAEEVFNSVSPGAQRGLGNVLNELVTIGESDDGAVARQQATLARLTGSPEQRELVERFIAERLLTTDRDDKNEATVSVAHESLLRAWPRAAQWIEANREFLAGRARVQQDLERWQDEGEQPDYLIAAGKPLEDARALLAMGRDRLTPKQRDYVERSAAFHTKREQRQLRRIRIVAGVFLVLAVVACGVGIFAWLQKNRALVAEKVAESERDRAQSESEKNRQLNVELEEQLYENRIAVAERELTQNQDVDLATRLLENCPPNLRGWEWHYLMRLIDGRRRSLIGHTGGLWSATFGPDGARIITAGTDGTARIWNATTGSLELTFSRHNLPVVAARALLRSQDLPDLPVKHAIFSPDGRFVASGSLTPSFRRGTAEEAFMNVDVRGARGTILVWDAMSGNVVTTFNNQTGLVLTLAFSPNGKQIASSSINPEHTFVAWEAATGTVQKVIAGHTGHVYALIYSPDGRRLLSGGIDGMIKVWDAQTFEHIRTIEAHPAPVMAIDFSPKGEEFASAGQDGTVRIWDSSTLESRRILRGHTGSALGVAYHPDGSRIASAGFDKTVRIWDPKTGRMKIALRQHEDTVWTVDFSPDGRRLVSASYDRTAQIWDATPLQPEARPGVFTLQGHTDRVNGVAFSRDGHLLATTSWDTTVRLWDAQTGKPHFTLKGHLGPVWGVAFSPDSRRIASAGWDQKVRLWDTTTGEQIAVYDEHEAPVHDVAFSPDGLLVIASCWDGMIKVWDVQTGKLRLSIDASLFPVLGIDVSPDGRRVAAALGDRAVAIWDLATGRKLLTIEKAHKVNLYDVAFSPDGNRLVSSSWDHIATVWNVDPAFEGTAQQRRVMDLVGHEDRVHGVAYSPDGKYIATASDDKQVRIWNAQTGAVAALPFQHRGVVWAIAFGSDSRRVAVGTWTESGWARTWQIDELERPTPRTAQ